MILQGAASLLSNPAQLVHEVEGFQGKEREKIILRVARRDPPWGECRIGEIPEVESQNHLRLAVDCTGKNVPILLLIGAFGHQMLMPTDQSLWKNAAKLRLKALGQILGPTELPDLCPLRLCQDFITPNRQLEPWLFSEKQQ